MSLLWSRPCYRERLMRGCALLLLVVCALGCDRNIEPFVPGEEPEQPDLSKIFPAGAERSAEGELALPEAPGRDGGRGAPPVAASGPAIVGTVTLAPELEGRVPQGAVLFLIARSAASGPPLAVKRIPSPSFPLRFSLGPEDRMIEALPFAGPLRVSARVDVDGEATTRSPGDLRGATPESVAPGARGVSVVIDEVL